MNRVCATGPPGKPAWATTMPLGRRHFAVQIERGEQQAGRMPSWAISSGEHDASGIDT